MLTERIAKGKQVKYLTVILREIDKGDEQKIDGGTVYKQMLMNVKLQIGKRD